MKKICVLLLIILTLSSCNNSPLTMGILPSLVSGLIPEKPYPAMTPFIVSELPTSQKISSPQKNQPFFKHITQHYKQVVLSEDLVFEDAKVLPLKKGTKFFSVLADFKIDKQNGENQKSIFCTLLSKQSGLAKFFGSAYSGDDILCLNDVNKDGKFDIAYNAVGAITDPLAVYVIQRKTLDLKFPIAYEKIQRDAKKNAGNVWFEIRKPLLSSLNIVFLFGSDQKEVLLGTVAINKKNLPQEVRLGGALIEIKSNNGQLSFDLINPIRINHTYFIRKTVQVTIR